MIGSRRHPQSDHRRLKPPQLFQGELSRVNSRSEIGNVVISAFHGTPLESGVMKQTPATPPAPDCFPQRLRMLVVVDDPVVEALCACSKAQPLFQVVGTAVGGEAGILTNILVAIGKPLLIVSQEPANLSE